MSTRIPVSVALVFMLCLSACTSGDGDKGDNRDAPSSKMEQPNAVKSASDLMVVRGHYVFGHEVRTLRPCGKDDTMWVVDRTNLLKDLHAEMAPATTPYAEIFVVAKCTLGPPPNEGFGADYPSQVSIEKVIYAAFEGFGCDFDWSNFTYRAQGNEPFWMVDVLPNEMRLARPGHDDQTWTNLKKDKTDGAVIFHAIGEDRSTIQLIVEEKSSRDTMSGAYYGLSARLILDGETLTGHALRGTAPTGQKTVD